LKGRGGNVEEKISGGLLTGDDGVYSLQLTPLSWFNVPEVLKVQVVTSEEV
tara:strand:- start:141 stop:293 length:153 start_codon:yes stop_codon:yes gene_type:complete